MRSIINFLKKYVFYKSRLRNRMVFYFCIIALVPLLMMSSVVNSIINSSHNYDVSQLEMQILNQKVTEIEKFFNETVNILELRVGYEESVEIDKQQQTFILNGLLKENHAFQKVTFISLNGDESTKETRKKLNRGLVNVSQEEYFRHAVQGNSYVGGVYFTPSVEPRMMLASPVENRKGEIIQVIAAEISLTEIQRIVKELQLGTLGYVYVVADSGRLLAHSGLDSGSIGQSLAREPRVNAVLQGQTFTGFGEDDRYKSHFSDLPVVGAGRKVSSLNWGIFVEWPVAEADVVINSFKNQIINFVIFGIVGAFLLSNIFAASVIYPIRKLESFAQEVGRGNFDKQVKIKTKDELEELGIAMNTMTKGLLELKKLKDEFVFIAAHELQTPVTAIRGYISLIFTGTAGAISEQLKTFLEPIKEANDRLIQLINDLLEIARQDAGSIKVQLEPISISKIVNVVLDEISPTAKDKGVAINYETPDSLPKVLADSQKLKAVLANLVSNAIKYNREEGGHVIIAHEIKKDSIITHVEDNGIGIPKEHQPHMFEKFYRVKTEQTINITGTGLGLFIVKESLERMKGRIWFTTEVGKGTTFSFELMRS